MSGPASPSAAAAAAPVVTPALPEVAAPRKRSASSLDVPPAKVITVSRANRDDIVNTEDTLGNKKRAETLTVCFADLEARREYYSKRKFKHLYCDWVREFTKRGHQVVERTKDGGVVIRPYTRRDMRLYVANFQTVHLAVKNANLNNNWTMSSHWRRGANDNLRAMIFENREINMFVFDAFDRMAKRLNETGYRCYPLEKNRKLVPIDNWHPFEQADVIAVLKDPSSRRKRTNERRSAVRVGDGDQSLAPEDKDGGAGDVDNDATDIDNDGGVDTDDDDDDDGAYVYSELSSIGSPVAAASSSAAAVAPAVVPTVATPVPVAVVTPPPATVVPVVTPVPLRAPGVPPAVAALPPASAMTVAAGCRSFMESRAPFMTAVETRNYLLRVYEVAARASNALGHQTAEEFHAANVRSMIERVLTPENRAHVGVVGGQLTGSSSYDRLPAIIYTKQPRRGAPSSVIPIDADSESLCVVDTAAAVVSFVFGDIITDVNVLSRALLAVAAAAPVPVVAVFRRWTRPIKDLETALSASARNKNLAGILVLESNVFLSSTADMFNRPPRAETYVEFCDAINSMVAARVNQ